MVLVSQRLGIGYWVQSTAYRGLRRGLEYWVLGY